MRRKLSKELQDRIIYMIEKRLFSDVLIAKRTGVNHKTVSKMRKELGLPIVRSEPKEPVCIVPKPPQCPVAEYFDETRKVWVSVYKAMFAGGVRPSDTSNTKDWRVWFL